MPMRRHGNEVHLVLPGYFDNLIRGLAVSKDKLGFKAFVLQVGTKCNQVLPIPSHLFRLTQF